MKLKNIIPGAGRPKPLRLALLALCLGGMYATGWAATPPRNNNKTVDYEAVATKAFLAYDFDLAESTLDEWEEQLAKKRKDIPEILSEMRGRVMLARNMMQRVERIELIDSVNVDANEFFNYYVLSADAGEFVDPADLPGGLFPATPVVFRPADGKQLLFSKRTDAGHRLMRADVLDDGSMLEPLPVGDDISGGGDADYPYLCADGVTFYFASNGEGSLGGYDIFLSRFDSDGNAFQPQNLGMPYNSPDNDYLLVIDETNNLGWWATDRNHIPGMVTVYTFRPNPSRVNVPVTEPSLADYASLRKAVFTPGGRELIAELDDTTVDSEDGDTEAFSLSLGNGRVYTHLSDFNSEQARQAMRQLLQRRCDIADIEASLASLRARYAAGDKSTSSEILNLERRLLAEPPIQERLVNTIVSQETQR